MEKGMEKTAIFGGSFDPPHYGHYDIVKNLERLFDRVIVVPSYISPFKSGAVDANERFKLCKKLFTSEKTTVSRREISRQGVSYSVDTAKFLSKKGYGKLFWVIGSEELTRLTEWKDIDTLKKLVCFYVVSRPGYTPAAELIKTLKKRGIKLKAAPFAGLDISSTAIKIDLAFGKTNKYMPDLVYAYEKKTGAFDIYSKYVKALHRYGLADKRIVHTYGTALRGAELAKLYGASVHDAVVACILHDIAKSVDPEKYAGQVDVQGFPPPTLHAPIGAYIAKREFGVSDEIAHAIYAHSTGDGRMSLLDEIVYLADKTEMMRNYNEVFYFRYLCEADREYAMYTALGAVSEYKDTKPCEQTTRALMYYSKLVEGRECPQMPERDKVEPPPPPSVLPIVHPSTELGSLKSKSLRVKTEEVKSVQTVPDKSVAAVPTKQKPVNADGSSKGVAQTIAAELSLHKAHDIDIIDLDGKTIIADYFVVCSASSTTAVKALGDYVEDKMKKKYDLDPTRRDVDREWIALDYGFIIVHIFTDRTREFYNIERLWSDGKNIERYGD